MVLHLDYTGLTADDDFFSPVDEHRMAVACVNFGFAEHGYATGFLYAVDALVDRVLERGEDQDRLVYPIIFSGRHYLELRLKGLIRDASDLLDEAPPSSSLMTKHGLVPVWTRLVVLLVRILPDAAEQLDHVGRCVTEIDVMDPGSFTFRYATAKDGSPSLPKELHNVGLANFRRVLLKIAGVLEIFDQAIGDDLDSKAEYRAHLADEIGRFTNDLR